jgi:hypothetical protein
VQTSLTERQTLNAAIAAIPHQPEQILLQPLPRQGRVEFWHGCVAITVRGPDWHAVARVQRDHDSDTPWRWYGHETMKDQLGRAWERRFDMVTDDFGNLVEVE